MADVRVSWEWDGKDEVQRHLKKVEDALSPPGITESLSRGADTFVEAARGHAPVKSGALRNAIDKKEVSGTEFEISPWVNPGANDRGTSTSAYAVTQEDGMEIHAKEQPYMTFFWNGQWHRRTSVNVPGTHYMEEGFTEAAPGAARQVIEDVQRKIDD